VRTGTNREGIRVRSYIPGSATGQTQFGAKSDHGLSQLCYGLRRCIPGVTAYPPWTQLMPVGYGFARWSYGRDTVHVGRATVMPRTMPSLFRSPVSPCESRLFKKNETTGATSR